MLGLIRAFFLYLIIGTTFILSYFIFKIINLINLENSRELKKKMFIKIFNFLFKFIFWIKLEIENDIILDLKKERYIFTCNHISFMDLFILILISNNFKNCHLCKFIGMEVILNWLIIGFVMKELDMIPIKMLDDVNSQNQYCEISKKQLKERCKSELLNGNSLFIFPEGRLNGNPSKLNKIHSGAYYLSKETDTPIKIIGLKNVDKIWKKQKHPFGYGIINIKIFNKTYKFSNSNEFRFKFKNMIENWINF
jgi:1-acyl-sn-glycerol-3-phosphate acyltransferase